MWNISSIWVRFLPTNAARTKLADALKSDALTTDPTRFGTPIIFALLAGIQYLKGQTLGYSVEFGVIWTVISLSIFAARRAYNFRKNIACQVCNDIPNQNENQP